VKPAARAALIWSPVVLVISAATGFGLTSLTQPMVSNRYFLWIIGRGSGLAAYVTIATLCLLGLWLRHPWRLRWPILHPETTLRLHAALGASTVVLLASHLISLALDKYAGVGWKGVFVPNAATYRPFAVSIGVICLYVILAIIVTARLGARLIGRRWLLVHQLSLPAFGAVFCHGVLAGTDTPALKVGYVVTGAMVVGLFITRRFARPAVAPIRSEGVIAESMVSSASAP